MKNKHTKAPWKVFYAKNNGEVILGVGAAEGMGIIASNGSFWGDDAEAKANSEHVVKCVNIHDELLGALELLLDANPNISGREAAQKAISKARGEL